MSHSCARRSVLTLLAGLLVPATAVHGETRALRTGGFAFELETGWGDTVEQAWRHLLIERFKPYMESRSGS
jgi:hypothetical protein